MTQTTSVILDQLIHYTFPKFMGQNIKHPHNGPHLNLYDQNIPCTVCYASTRAAMIMVPAKTECPSSWTREYYGYLMTERPNHHALIII